MTPFLARNQAVPLRLGESEAFAAGGVPGQEEPARHHLFPSPDAAPPAAPDERPQRVHWQMEVPA